MKNIIGTAQIKNLKELKEWLNTDYGKNYITYNWSKQRAGNNWEKYEKINFYELQKESQICGEFLEFLQKKSEIKEDMKCVNIASVGKI